jgi:hypothetical protein
LSSVQGVFQRALEQCGKLAPIAGTSGLARKVLQQPSGVVGFAKERAIESLGHPPDGSAGSNRDQNAEGRSGEAAQRTGRHHPRRSDREHADERPGKDKGQRHPDDDADYDDGMPDDEITGAAPEKYRKLHHAIPHNRVRKRKREEIEREDRTNPHPERQSQDLDAAQAAEFDVDHQDEHRQHAHRRTPEHHPRASSRLRWGKE